MLSRIRRNPLWAIWIVLVAGCSSKIGEAQDAAPPAPTYSVTTRLTNATAERQTSSVATGGASDVDLQQLTYRFSEVRLCREGKLSTTTEELEDDLSGETFKVAVLHWEVDHETCVSLGIGDGVEIPDTVNPCDYVNEGYVDLLDEAAVAEKLSSTAGIPAGVYRYVTVAAAGRVGVKAAALLKDGNGTEQTIYTKPCGPFTCGSNCDDNVANPTGGPWNVAICKGNITEPLKGTNVGDVHPVTGDIWSETPFDAYESMQASYAEPNRYWRRCQADMTQGPAELVHTLVPYAVTNIFELKVPLVVGEGTNLVQNDAGGFNQQLDLGPPDLTLDAILSDAALADAAPPPVVVSGKELDVLMMYNLQSIVSASAEEMIYHDSASPPGLGHRNYIDLTDGFYGIALSPLPMTPVVRRPDEQIVRYSYRARVRRDSARPACFKDGPDAPPSFSGDGFETAAACHPCHGYEMLCYRFGSSQVRNDLAFRMQDMTPSQEFDLRIDLYRVVDVGTGQPAELQDVRAVQVTAFYDGTTTPTRQLPFSALAVRKIEDNGDGSVNLMEPRSGIVPAGGQPIAENFARIRNLPLDLLTIGDTGKLIVMLDEEQIVNKESACESCDYNCTGVLCVTTQAYYEVPVELEAVNVVAGPK